MFSLSMHVICFFFYMYNSTYTCQNKDYYYYIKRRPPLGFTIFIFIFLNMGLINNGDKDNQIAPFGDTKRSLLIKAEVNGGSLNRGLTVYIIMMLICICRYILQTCTCHC